MSIALEKKFTFSFLFFIFNVVQNFFIEILSHFTPDNLSIELKIAFLDLPGRSFKLTFVRSFVRPSVTSFSRDWLISFFWFFAQWCKMIMPKMWRSPIFDKNFFWANLGKKPSKNRVFWTLCKIASLYFSDFLHKFSVQGPLKSGRNSFFQNFFWL